MSVERLGSSRRPERWMWAPALVLAAFVALWPVVGGERVTNDDLKFVRTTAFTDDLPGALADAWRHGHAFRPLEILVGRSCDPASLDPGLTVAVQAAGLAALLLATAALARRVAPAMPATAPVAVVLLLLSPGTTNGLWQMDAASQTWSAALGAVALVVAWRGVDTARDGKAPVRELLALGAIFLAGCSVKETFYGWSLALGLALGVSALRLGRTGTRAAGRVCLLLIPCVALPALHAVLRITTGALGSMPSGGDGGRYQAEFGLNLVVNAAFSVAGSIANGPFHVVTDSSASPLLRALPLVSSLFVIGILIVAGSFAWMHRRGGDRNLARALALAATCLASTAATLPAGSVSELYCFGSNIGASILLAASLSSLWWPASDDERTLGRSLAACSFAVLALIGAFGLAGRAYHHWITWQYARLANDAVLAHAAAVDPVDPASGKAAGVIYLSAPCILGRTYGQYVIPPAQAIGIDSTQPWLMKRDPTRPIVFSVNPPPGVLRPGDMVLDCSAMPRRASW